MRTYLIVLIAVVGAALLWGASRSLTNKQTEVPLTNQTPETQPVDPASPSATTPEVSEPVVPEEADVAVLSGPTINLSNQGLTKVPDNVFNNTNTVSLDVSGNKLDGALQAEVRYLQKLEVLDLSDNNFTGVPAEVGQLSKLRVLDLSNNPLTGLPYELGNLHNLEVLDLRGTNYAVDDLTIIRATLPTNVTIKL